MSEFIKNAKESPQTSAAGLGSLVFAVGYTALVCLKAYVEHKVPDVDSLTTQIGIISVAVVTGFVGLLAKDQKNPVARFIAKALPHQVDEAAEKELTSVLTNVIRTGVEQIESHK